MDRKDFLNSIGMSAAAFALINCIGCKKTDGSSSSGPSGPTGVDFTLDLSLTGNAALLNNGGSLVSNGLIVARTTSGNYIAVQRYCTHQTYPLTYEPSDHLFYCPSHGSTFSETGAVTNGPAARSLSVYHTQQTGSSLRVYS